MIENEQLLNDISKLLKSIKWGSVLIQIQNGEVTQITKQEVLKVKNPQYHKPQDTAAGGSS